MSTFIGSIPERNKTCKVTFANVDKTVECEPYTNLRQLAIDNDIDLYNGLSRYLNCEGNGICGTCTVEITPPDGATKKGAKENLRFLLLKGNLRLSCQAGVVEDIVVTKHDGLKGNRGYSAEVDKAEIVRRYKEDEWTVDQIAAHHNQTSAKVVTILLNAGVEMRRPGSAA